MDTPEYVTGVARTRGDLNPPEYVGAVKVRTAAEGTALQDAIRRHFGNTETWQFGLGYQPQVGFAAKSPESFTCINYFAMGFLAARGGL